MSDKKLSSVQWLVEQLRKNEFIDDPTELIEEAKAMHKAEIINAYQAGDGDAYNLDETRDFGEQYYNETFGGNNE